MLLLGWTWLFLASVAPSRGLTSENFPHFPPFGWSCLQVTHGACAPYDNCLASCAVSWVCPHRQHLRLQCTDRKPNHRGTAGARRDSAWFMPWGCSCNKIERKVFAAHTHCSHVRRGSERVCHWCHSTCGINALRQRHILVRWQSRPPHCTFSLFLYDFNHFNHLNCS